MTATPPLRNWHPVSAATTDAQFAEAHACRWDDHLERFAADWALLRNTARACCGAVAVPGTPGMTIVPHILVDGPLKQVQGLDSAVLEQLVHQTAVDHPGWELAGDVDDPILDRLDAHFTPVISKGAEVAAIAEAMYAAAIKAGEERQAAALEESGRA